MLSFGLNPAGQAQGPFRDGGLYDRTGLKAWRQRRAAQGRGIPPALVHLIARSSSFSGADDVESTGETCFQHRCIVCCIFWS